MMLFYYPYNIFTLINPNLSIFNIRVAVGTALAGVE